MESRTLECSSRQKVAGSRGQEMQSTANYLWHTDDLLGQGATASVYKARNKVGPSPGPHGPLWPRQPPWAARRCVAGQRPLDLALHTLGSGTLGV